MRNLQLFSYVKAGFLALILGFALKGSEAKAQIVNIQEALSGYIPRGLNLQGELNQVERKGNIDSDNFNAQAMITLREKKYLILLIAKREYGAAFGDKSTDSHFDHLRFAYYFTKHFGWEAFAQDDSDSFRRSKERTLYGTGPRYQIAINRDFTLALSGAYMKEHETFSPYEIPGDYYYDQATDEVLKRESTFVYDASRSNDRLSAMIYFNWFIGRYVSLSDTVYYQPKVGDSKDVKSLIDSSVIFGLSDKVSLRVLYSLSYNSNPPFAVKRSDTTLDESIVVNLNFALNGNVKSSETDMAKRRNKLREAVKP